MGLFKTKQETYWEPYRDKSYNLIYNLLFCDNYSLYKTIPLFSRELDSSEFYSIVNDPKAETRYRILAFNQLRAKGKTVERQGLLGVIIEVGLPQGLDTLAVYQDHRCRYINQFGKMLVWEASNPKIDEEINELLTVSQIAFLKIGLWEKNRLPPPQKGLIRVTFLGSDGIRFGQGPIDVLSKDSIGGPVIVRGVSLITAFTELAKKNK